MRINSNCESCLLEKQKARVKSVKDREKREAYLEQVQKTLKNRKEEDSAPYMVYCFNQIFKDYFGETKSYAEIKKNYNHLVMSIENEIEERIIHSPDPLEASIVYARIGNYIDFGAMNHVEKQTFLDLFKKESSTGLDPYVYKEFIGECEKVNNFLLLCDNCGEIVLDKLFVRELKKRFPHLTITVMVRGEEVLNDATMEDAVCCGMDSEVKVISNGNGVAGTVIEMLSEEAGAYLEKADLILSKGQGNYESLAGCGRNIFYSFLCKCNLFTERFGVPELTGMFVREKQ